MSGATAKCFVVCAKWGSGGLTGFILAPAVGVFPTPLLPPGDGSGPALHVDLHAPHVAGRALRESCPHD